MKHYAVHICNFSSTDELRGKTLTYENIKAVVLKAGRFSVFDATQTDKHARLFDRLERDPEIETYRNPPGYPWIGVRERVR